MKALLKPPPIALDAAISIVAPASFAQPDRVDRGVAAFRALGYAPKFAANALLREPLYFAGTPQQRLGDLHAAFADPDTAAIMSIRGGYGSNYLLDNLDLETIAVHPKPFFAYSDLTGIQLRLLDELGLPVFHGPMLAADFYLPNGVHLESFRAADAHRGPLRGPRHSLWRLPQHSHFASRHTMGAQHRGRSALS
ncbi:MAG: LD-carboxypeptidase [Terracidiphilus sp.]